MESLKRVHFAQGRCVSAPRASAGHVFGCLGPGLGPSSRLSRTLPSRKLRRVNECADGYEPGGRRFESCWAHQVLHLSILASAGVPSERLVKTRRSQLRILLARHLISFTHYALRPSSLQCCWVQLRTWVQQRDEDAPGSPRFTGLAGS